MTARMSTNELVKLAPDTEPMKKRFFKTLASINKAILPRYSQRDINKLSKIDKAIVAYRYWVTVHALD